MCAWDSNPGPQNGRRRRNHGAMGASLDGDEQQHRPMWEGIRAMFGRPDKVMKGMSVAVAPKVVIEFLLDFEEKIYEAQN